jgi:hypothetical protein
VQPGDQRGGAQRSAMKKYIRQMIEDLKHPKQNKDFIPPAPKTPKENPAMPKDLSNQVLSTNPEERVKQLDYQAFESERLQTDE